MGRCKGRATRKNPTYITILTMWTVRLPLAFLLMFRFGLQARGAWIAMSVSTIVGGLMAMGLFRSGKWKRIKV